MKKKIGIISLLVLGLYLFLFSQVQNNPKIPTWMLPNIFPRVNTLSDGLVGYWPFDEGSGTLAVDYSGHGNDGTLYNMTEDDWVSGVVGSCLDFDGVDDYVRVTTTMTAPSIPISISMWVYSPVSNPIGLFDSAPMTQNVLRNYPAGYVEWWSTNPQLLFNVDINTWTHLVFIYKFVSGNRTIEWYKNGVYQASATGDTTTTVGWNDFTIGAINTVSHLFTGKIDEFRIYNRALTAEEIKELYLNP